MSQIASKARTREILETYDIAPRKRFGQNFIVEPGIVNKIAAAIAQRELDAIVEIGPGIGALTEPLTKISVPVLAYEVDTKLKDILENEIQAENLKIILQDFLQVDVDELLEKIDEDLNPKTGQGQGKVGFVSNLPYYITTPILFKLLEASRPIDSITAMMQKEVAERILARPNSKEYNALSLIVQYLCTVKKIMDVNRNVFWPSPNVDSIVLQFTFDKERPLKPKEQAEFFSFLKEAFKQRRKTLANNLSNYMENKEDLERVLKEQGLNASIRAQELDLEQFLALFQALKPYRKADINMEKGEQVNGKQ